MFVILGCGFYLQHILQYLQGGQSIPLPPCQIRLAYAWYMEPVINWSFLLDFSNPQGCISIEPIAFFPDHVFDIFWIQEIKFATKRETMAELSKTQHFNLDAHVALASSLRDVSPR